MRYTEILKLKEMLEEANIPFTFTDDFFNVKEKIAAEGPVAKVFYSHQYPAYQIRLGDLADAIEHCYSIGSLADKLEIMGGLTEEEMEYDGVLGFLTAEEVFKRFKYCWEHQTDVYKETEDHKSLPDRETAEMAKAMADFELKDTAKCDTELSEHLFAKGYRKQSDTVREFVEKIEEVACQIRYEASRVYQGRNQAEAQQAYGAMDAIEKLMRQINELAKEYGAEVKGNEV